MKTELKKFEIWFVTASRHLNGPETLKKVARHSQEVARALGKTNDAAQFAQRSQNYRNVRDGGTGFFRSKKADGTYREP
jgi:hypothetical protein